MEDEEQKPEAATATTDNAEPEAAPPSSSPPPPPPPAAAAETASEKKEEKEPEEEEPEPAAEKTPEKKKKQTPVKSPEKEAGESSGGRRSSGREKRERKTSAAFVPEDFSKVDRTVEILEGRGTKLEDIPAVRDSIEEAGLQDPALEMTHKLLYKSRGKPPKKDMLANVLAFSGYLPKATAGQGETEDEQEKVDEADHVRVFFVNCCRLMLISP